MSMWTLLHCLFQIRHPLLKCSTVTPESVVLPSLSVESGPHGEGGCLRPLQGSPFNCIIIGFISHFSVVS